MSTYDPIAPLYSYKKQTNSPIIPGCWEYSILNVGGLFLLVFHVLIDYKTGSSAHITVTMSITLTNIRYSRGICLSDRYKTHSSTINVHFSTTLSESSGRSSLLTLVPCNQRFTSQSLVIVRILPQDITNILARYPDTVS